MLSFKHKKQKVKVASCYEELNVDQLQKLVATKFKDNVDDWLRVFSILSGISYTAVRDSKDNSIESALYAGVRFVFEQPFDFESLPMPTFVVIKGKTVLIPKNLGRLSIGQAIQVRQRIEKTKDLREALSIATAVYLQPIVDDEPFDYARAEVLEQEILQMPATKIFPIGFFLLRRLTRSGNPLKRIWLLMRLMITSVEGK